MSGFLAPMVILVIVLLQVRPMCRPLINRSRWGTASTGRELARIGLVLVVGITGMWVGEAVSRSWGYALMALAGAIALSWLPGAIRQSIRLSRIPDELEEGRKAVIHERVPDLTFLAVLVSPDGVDVPPHMNLERNARFLGNLPDTNVQADDIPALRKFIEAAVFDEYAARPFNDKPGKTRILMNSYEFQTTLDMEFERILEQVTQFVQRPTEEWAGLGEAAMSFGAENALFYGNLPDEYFAELVPRREVVRLGW